MQPFYKLAVTLIALAFFSSSETVALPQGNLPTANFGSEESNNGPSKSLEGFLENTHIFVELIPLSLRDVEF